ncbi:hypothetical protein [Brucella pituitosa]|uniref:hypothetical protein n=1 Tax=Brucella pituitosa TaxID=571256 RepID=UPI00137471FB|nr:hypothetical protein [Brucella pituitosa]
MNMPANLRAAAHNGQPSAADFSYGADEADAVVCQPRYSAGAPVYEGYVQNMQVLNKLPSLEQRVGNRSLSIGV